MDEARKLDSYTYEEYLAIDQSLRQGERCELIFGEIHMMAGASAAHQDTVLNIATLLKNLTRDTPTCKARIAPYDLKLQCRGSTHVVQPDVMLWCSNTERPCALFEVLSPSTAKKDKGVKKELYELCGIQNYYLVDPENRIVDHYRLLDGRYWYVRGFSGTEMLSLAPCIEGALEVESLFEGLE